MMRKECYQTPRVLKTVTVLLERGLLDSLITKDSRVRTMGQEVINKDFSGPSFVQEWDTTPFNQGGE